MTRASLALLAAVAALAAGCGGDDGKTPVASTPVSEEPSTRAEVLEELPGQARPSFDPEAIYENQGPGVVTIVSIFDSSGLAGALRGGGDDDEDNGPAGQGSGFVVSKEGEIATNAHVVTEGKGNAIKKAEEVYVQFADRNQVEAKIVGFDADSDVALLKIDPAGLKLRPLSFGSVSKLRVGEPVAAIGSPFGEPQSLSIGIVSATGRSIQSLTGFAISGAVQTDAAINHGNSGGPLLDSAGRVIGINSQIQSTGGGGEGVGFAVPADRVKRSIREIHDEGEVSYAYLGIQTSAVYPQLARKFDLGTDRGAWVQKVTDDSPASDGDVKGGDGKLTRFQAGRYEKGGDVIVGIAGEPVRSPDDLGRILDKHRPGETIEVEVVRDRDRKTLKLKVGERPTDVTP